MIAVLLVIAFIASAIAVPYYVGVINEKIFKDELEGFAEKWVRGWVCLVVTFIPVSLFLVLFKAAKLLIG